jgi:hypothetical protein
MVYFGGSHDGFFFLGAILLKHTPHLLKAKNTCFLLKKAITPPIQAHT